MASKDGLLRLQSRLAVRRDALRKALAGDWQDNRRFTARNEVGDTVDAALDSANDEISSRFAEIESHELEQVEHALQRIIEGVYGRCEYCGQRIAATRLNALPYTNSCIGCQRENEQNEPEYGSGADDKRWARAYEKPNLEESSSDSPIRLRDFEINLCKIP
jgi:DnaK suppressor protein